MMIWTGVPGLLRAPTRRRVIGPVLGHLASEGLQVQVPSLREEFNA